MRRVIYSLAAALSLFALVLQLTAVQSQAASNGRVLKQGKSAVFCGGGGGGCFGIKEYNLGGSVSGAQTLDSAGWTFQVTAPILQQGLCPVVNINFSDGAGGRSRGQYVKDINVCNYFYAGHNAPGVHVLVYSSYVIASCKWAGLWGILSGPDGPPVVTTTINNETTVTVAPSVQHCKTNLQCQAIIGQQAARYACIVKASLQCVVHNVPLKFVSQIGGHTAVVNGKYMVTFKAKKAGMKGTFFKLGAREGNN